MFNQAAKCIYKFAYLKLVLSIVCMFINAISKQNSYVINIIVDYEEAEFEKKIRKNRSTGKFVNFYRGNEVRYRICDG